ncbi:DNA cytosine methyltransferase [Streptomyces tremellae]|uniref:DNA (cytosine-5-)-methyltransferase n=1 Tax=Streptomyces tremellae TaxID=1124239 RepID=A0ABP7FJX0_9ACTN
MQGVRIVDLFAGPGGLDVAADQLGIPSIGIEWDDDACATRRANGLQTIQGDVREFGPQEQPFVGATVLAGGPPCQTYTVAGTGAGRRALDDVIALARSMAARENVKDHVAERLDAPTGDVRTGLVLEPLRWALEAADAGAPYRAIVLEQVPAVLPVWLEVVRVLKKEGYTATAEVLNAEMYGVPQTRRRAVLIAWLESEGRGEARMPEPTHQGYRKGVPPVSGAAKPLPWVPMRQVITRPERFEVVSNYGTGGDPKERGRRRYDEPSATVTGKVSRNRVVSLSGDDLDRFSNEEAGALQTFPPSFKWRGRNIAQQIGNAIPPRLAKHVLATALGLALHPENTEVIGTVEPRPVQEMLG